eukprot:TRINITY_DN15206_c0_g2_i3.p1 TRINITY_DN15206_c0_g2~~TRINITY_DN15206_c0_g2_i3.p1  ORF type:complete len:565 (-),score=61.28 TRINITY_DN15206_c0_g2_i3:76-1770(-)
MEPTKQARRDELTAVVVRGANGAVTLNNNVFGTIRMAATDSLQAHRIFCRCANSVADLVSLCGPGQSTSATYNNFELLIRGHCGPMEDIVEIDDDDTNVAKVTIHAPNARLWHVGMHAATRVVDEFIMKTQKAAAPPPIVTHLRVVWPFILVDGSLRTGKTQTARYILPAILAKKTSKPVHVAYISLTAPASQYCNAFYDELAQGLGDIIRCALDRPISAVNAKDLIRHHIPMDGILVVVLDEIQNYCGPNPVERDAFFALLKALFAWEQPDVLFVVTGSTGACLHQSLDTAPPNGGTLHEKAINLLIPVSDDAGASALFPRLFSLDEKASTFQEIKNTLLNVNPAYVAQYKAAPVSRIKQEIFNIYQRDLQLCPLTRKRIDYLFALGSGQQLNPWIEQWSSVVHVVNGNMVWTDHLFIVFLGAALSLDAVSGEYIIADVDNNKAGACISLLPIALFCARFLEYDKINALPDFAALFPPLIDFFATIPADPPALVLWLQVNLHETDPLKRKFYLLRHLRNVAWGHPTGETMTQGSLQLTQWLGSPQKVHELGMLLVTACEVLPI